MVVIVHTVFAIPLLLILIIKVKVDQVCPPSTQTRDPGWTRPPVAFGDRTTPVPEP